MLNLKNITLVCIGSTNINFSLKAIDICIKFASFYDVKYFTDATTPYTISIPKLSSIREYDTFVVKELPKHINSDYVLSIHYDGFIVNPEAWSEEFLKYDYIGAPWPWWNNICGNGGFCLKSKKFLDTQTYIFDDSFVAKQADDVILSKDYRELFHKFGCNYAPPDISYKFSTEWGGYDNYNSFGFHDFRLNPQFKKLINYE